MLSLIMGSKMRSIALWAILVASVGIGAWWGYNHVWNKGYSQKTLEMEAINASIYAVHLAELTLKGIEHDKNQLTINRLAADAKRLRVKVIVPSCQDATAENNDRGTGVFSTTLNGALEKLREADESDALRADQLNIDATRSNP